MVSKLRKTNCSQRRTTPIFRLFVLPITRRRSLHTGAPAECSTAAGRNAVQCYIKERLIRCSAAVKKPERHTHRRHKEHKKDIQSGSAAGDLSFFASQHKKRCRKYPETVNGSAPICRPQAVRREFKDEGNQKTSAAAVRRKCVGHPQSRALPQNELATLFSGLLFPIDNQQNSNHTSADQHKSDKICKQKDRIERNR